MKVSNKLPNKALHPTAYSLRFGRSSLRSGFRRRASLVVRRLRAAWRHLQNSVYNFGVPILAERNAKHRSNRELRKAIGMKLYLMQLATLQPDDIPVPAYLVQTDEGVNILIDSGFPESFASNSIELPGGRKVEMAADGFIVNRLNVIGLRPEDIHIVLCTHLDADHAGGHASFPSAEFVVQRAHYEIARESEHPRFAALRETWNHPSLRYRFVEGDVELVPGVELIETGGHVPAHRSVLVRLPNTGPTLLAIDAVPHSSMTDADTRIVMPIDMDEKDTRSSTRKLAEIIQREGVALTIYGHDSEQWKTLKQAPESYS